MAIDALRGKNCENKPFTHKPKHDLKSLFYVILNLCTYTTGPSCLHTYISGTGEHSVCLNEWWTTSDNHCFAHLKASQIDSLDDSILQHLPPYWNDFHSVLKDLHKAIWCDTWCTVQTQDNLATHQDFLDVLIKARDHYSTTEKDNVVNFAPIPPLRSDKCTGWSSVSG